MNASVNTMIVGIGATLLTDLWGAIRVRVFGVPAPNYCWVGRWMARIACGRFAPIPIGTLPPLRAECAIGWAAHYSIGVLFAAMLIGVCGIEWLRAPVFTPALAVGVLTVIAPFLIMQPGMGAGIAASRTPKPTLARLHTVATHAVFGTGLYVSARVVNYIWQA